MRFSRLWMRSRRVLSERLIANAVVATRTSPGFNPGILRHSGNEGWQPADEAVLNKVQKEKKNNKNTCSKQLYREYTDSLRLLC
jgi:hypothetical protein